MRLPQLCKAIINRYFIVVRRIKPMCEVNGKRFVCEGFFFPLFSLILLLGSNCFSGDE